jgi:hypothetical protein
LRRFLKTAEAANILATFFHRKINFMY